jgi:NADH-quinone oxidoreductase subunit M
VSLLLRGRHLLLVAVCALACLMVLASRVAHAGPPTPTRPGGHIALSIPGGGVGPLVLEPGQGGWVGTLTVTNVGAETLIISRVAIRGDEDDVRSPARLGVRFVEGPATSATLAPGATKDLVVSWMPDKDPRVKQAFGHVVVTSTDEESGEVAMGFRAQVPTELGWLGEHALSMLVLLPLMVILVAAASRLAGRRDDPFVGHVAVGMAVVELLLALWVYTRFATDLGRADGNDGFQLVERWVWIRSIGAEWYVGLDGVSIALVPLGAVLWLVALVVVRERRRTDAYFSATALLAASVCGVLVGLDLVVVFAAWQLVLVALVMLVGGWGGPRADHAAAKLAGYGALGSAAMLCAFVALSRASGRTFLVDGTAALHTLSIPELARTSFAARAPILGLPFHEVTWGLLFVAVAVTTPVVPMHGWLPEVLEEAPAGAGIFVAGIVTALGPYLLVRVGLGAMPEGARWAGASIAALGVISVGYGALCAMAQRDLRRFVAYVSIASAGGTLFGIAAFTAQGIGGAMVGTFARGLAAALLLGVASALERRLRTTSLTRLAGLSLEAPRLAAALAVGLATSLGVPCLAGFWGPLLSLMGGFGRHPALGLLFAACIVALAVAHLRVARLTLLGRFDDAWRTSAALEVHRGKMPDLSSRELAALAAVALLVGAVGVWPTPLLSAMASGVRDVGATVEPPVDIP